MVAKVLFTCEFCGQHFKTENGFMRHHCDKMQREEDFKSINGQAALLYYKEWMFLKHHSRIVNADGFKTSAYFTAFFKFYAFVQQTQLPCVNTFIQLMVRRKIDPKFWCMGETYKIYLEYITYQLPLDEHIKITIKTLFDCADAADINISNVFDVLTPNDVIQLLHQRKLSPWLLLKSKKFAQLALNTASSEERIILQTVIKPEYWQKKYKNNPKEAKKIEGYIAELGL